MIQRPVRVLVAIGQRLFSEALIGLFRQTDQVEVVGASPTGARALDDVASEHPDVILLDIQLPVLDGISVAQHLQSVDSPTQIVVLSSNHSEEQVREAFEAGARGYLLKDCSFEEVLLALKKAAAGDYYVTGPAGFDLVAEYVKPHIDHEHPGGIMTQRERELARLLADGYSSKEAADVLNISIKTVETHRASIMKKLNARNVTDIVKYCIRNQIIEP